MKKPIRTMNKTRIAAASLAFVLLAGTAVAFAAQKADLTRTETFYSVTKDESEFDYETPNPYRYKGGEYVPVSDVEYEVIKDKGAETKTVEFENVSKDSIPKEKTFTVDGEEVTYILNTEKTEYEPAKKVATYTYKGENPYNFKPASSRTLKDQMGNSFTGTLSGTQRGSIYSVPVTVSGKFTADRDAEYFYFANTGNLWQYNDKAPNWKGYENDILDYLKLDGRIYTITGGKWSSNEKSANGTVTRTAIFNATQKKADYTCTYSLGNGDPSLFNVKAVYDSPYSIKATVKYAEAKNDEEEENSILPMVLIGGGILVGAGAIAAIIYYLAKRRSDEDDEPEDN